MLETMLSKYENRIQNILIAVGVYTILPFLIISQYNRPAADDYDIAVRYSRHSLSYLIKDTYLNWSGRYFASLISALDPVNYKDYEIYKLLPVAFILVFAIAMFLLIRTIAKEYLNSKQILALSSLMIYLYIAAVPSSSEAFYWFPSACIYHLSDIFYLLLLIQLYKLQKPIKYTRKLFHFFYASVIAVIIIGSNEISMIITMFSIFMFSISVWAGKKEMLSWFLLLCLIGIIASGISVFSPGNLKRLEYYQYFTQSSIWTITGAGGITFFYFLQWALLILIATLIYIPFIGIPLAQKLSLNKITVSFKLKTFAFLSVALILFLQLFAVWFAGGSNLGRIENVIYLFFLLAYFFGLQLFINQLSIEKKNSFITNKFFLSIAVTTFAVTVFDLNNNISTAYIDLISGKAIKYDKELSERDEIAKLCKTDTCYVPPLKNVPKTIFFTDIKSLGEDTTNFWINEVYSTFMHSGLVVTSGFQPPLKSNLETIKETGKNIRSKFFQ